MKGPTVIMFLLLFCVINFQPDHVHWSKMTLPNKSDDTSSPSFPLSSLEHNFSVYVTNDPSYSPISFPTSSSSLLTSTNCTSSASPYSPPYNFYAVLLVLLIFCVVFGNVLVCVAVSRERALQTTTNYLIVSLAVSDLLLATLVMPWGVYLEVCALVFVFPSFLVYFFVVQKKDKKKQRIKSLDAMEIKRIRVFGSFQPFSSKHKANETSNILDKNMSRLITSLPEFHICCFV